MHTWMNFNLLSSFLKIIFHTNGFKHYIKCITKSSLHWKLTFGSQYKLLYPSLRYTFFYLILWIDSKSMTHHSINYLILWIDSQSMTHHSIIYLILWIDSKSMTHHSINYLILIMHLFKSMTMIIRRNKDHQKGSLYHHSIACESYLWYCTGSWRHLHSHTSSLIQSRWEWIKKQNVGKKEHWRAHYLYPLPWVSSTECWNYSGWITWRLWQSKKVYSKGFPIP